MLKTSKYKTASVPKRNKYGRDVTYFNLRFNEVVFQDLMQIVKKTKTKYNNYIPN